MGNLDELLEEMLLKGYSKVISSEEKILKSLDGLGLKEFNTLDAIWLLNAFEIPYEAKDFNSATLLITLT